VSTTKDSGSKLFYLGLATSNGTDLISARARGGERSLFRLKQLRENFFTAYKGTISTGVVIDSGGSAKK
jgi:hypothetical protein